MISIRYDDWVLGGFLTARGVPESTVLRASGLG